MEGWEQHNEKIEKNRGGEDIQVLRPRGGGGGVCCVCSSLTAKMERLKIERKR